MNRHPVAMAAFAAMALLVAACGDKVPPLQDADPAALAQEPIDEGPEEPTDEAPDEPTDEGPEEPTDEAPDEPTDEGPEEPTDEAPDEPTDEGPEEPAEGLDDPAGGTTPSELPEVVHQLEVDEATTVTSSSGDDIGQITLLEVATDFECENPPIDGRPVVAIRLATEVEANAIGFIDVQAHTARAETEAGDPVFHQQEFSCVSEGQIPQITDDGQSNEGWFYVRVGPSATSFAWDHGSGDDWVRVDISEDAS